MNVETRKDPITLCHASDVTALIWRFIKCNAWRKPSSASAWNMSPPNEPRVVWGTRHPSQNMQNN
jgi:hypothetical protein